MSAEMGEEMALSVLAAKILKKVQMTFYCTQGCRGYTNQNIPNFLFSYLAFCWCVSVSVVIEDVVLREVTSTFQKVPAHSLTCKKLKFRKKIGLIKALADVNHVW